MYAIRNILHPTDFSESAQHAFRLAYSLARALGAKVTVLHVIPPMTWSEELAARPPDSYRDQLWNENLVPLKATEPAVKVTHRLEDGDVVEKIVEVAQEAPYDLIVMGTHGRTGLTRVVVGSVAERTQRSAPCPVLVVRTPLPEFDKEARPKGKEPAVLVGSSRAPKQKENGLPEDELGAGD